MKVSKVEVVLTFDPDETIIMSYGPSLKALQKRLGGRLLMINAPENAPPPLPRAILKMEDTIFNVGLDRFHITMIPPSHVFEDFQKAITFVRQRVFNIIGDLLQAMTSYHWSGVVVELEFPEAPLTSSSASEAAIPLFKRLVNLNAEGKKLGSFQLQFGIRDGDHFVTYTITSYESRQIELRPPVKSGFFIVDPMIYPLTECGIRIVLDVNSKPKRKNENPKSDIMDILRKLSDFQQTLITDLNLKGIIS